MATQWVQRVETQCAADMDEAHCRRRPQKDDAEGSVAYGAVRDGEENDALARQSGAGVAGDQTNLMARRSERPDQAAAEFASAFDG